MLACGSAGWVLSRPFDTKTGVQCYARVFQDKKVAFAEAKARCKAADSVLTSVKGKQEMTTLLAMLQEADLPGGAWIGAERDPSTLKFEKWADGSAITKKSSFWADGEPNNFLNQVRRQPTPNGF